MEQAEGVVEMAVLPPRESMRGVPHVTTSIRMPKEILEEVDQVAQERGYSRNETLWQLIRAGLAAIREEIASDAAVERAAEEREDLLKQVARLNAEVAALKKSRK